MRLITKLTLFVTVSKLAIVGLFVLVLPSLVGKIAFEYTNSYLRQQEKKVMEVVGENGIDYYLQGEESYGSYTLLKEEYISLEPAGAAYPRDTIETASRIIESDTITYRLLTKVFRENGKPYILEIGKNIATISQYNTPLQKVALYALISLIGLSLVVDLFFTRLLIKPLSEIIKKRLVGQSFPFNTAQQAIKTSTSDFRYLDDSLTKLMVRINEDFEKEKQFTSNASHELMTPIGILQSKMENLLMDEELDEQAQEKLMGMMNTLNRLKKIVNALLLISRIENDQYMRKDEVLPGNLLREILDELMHRAEEKEITITVKLNRVEPIRAMNRDLIFQLLYNLVNNAIRYNKPGSWITIYDSSEINDSPNFKSAYQLIIEDGGIGIAPAELPGVFDRFRKAGSKQGEGQGLGLSIVKSIAQYHDIHIDIHSVLNEGTKVILNFQEPGQAEV